MEFLNGNVLENEISPNGEQNWLYEIFVNIHYGDGTSAEGTPFWIRNGKVIFGME
ncbi:hypothetical protein ACLIA0_10145 [Bacillaceae bacterium W0354]